MKPISRIQLKPKKRKILASARVFTTTEPVTPEPVTVAAENHQNQDALLSLPLSPEIKALPPLPTTKKTSDKVSRKTKVQNKESLKKAPLKHFEGFELEG